MNEQTHDHDFNLDDEDTPSNPLDELALLKERAKTMGIPISGNIGIDALKKKIQHYLDGKKDEEVHEASDSKAAPRKSKIMLEQELRERLQKEEMALVRCKIYNLNPAKRDLHGEIITVANKYLGTVRKFIPFGEATDNGYHIPKIVYNDLKARQFQHIQTKQNGGKIDVKTRMVPEYNIEILPPLSEDELQELALKQAAAERLGSE
jgi:hypothetical protein